MKCVDVDEDGKLALTQRSSCLYLPDFCFDSALLDNAIEDEFEAPSDEFKTVIQQRFCSKKPSKLADLGKMVAQKWPSGIGNYYVFEGWFFKFETLDPVKFIKTMDKNSKRQLQLHQRAKKIDLYIYLRAFVTHESAASPVEVYIINDEENRGVLSSVLSKDFNYSSDVHSENFKRNLKNLSKYLHGLVVAK